LPGRKQGLPIAKIGQKVPDPLLQRIKRAISGNTRDQQPVPHSGCAIPGRDPCRKRKPVSVRGTFQTHRTGPTAHRLLSKDGDSDDTRPRLSNCAGRPAQF
jgi:hypothetical protein